MADLLGRPMSPNFDHLIGSATTLTDELNRKYIALALAEQIQQRSTGVVAVYGTWGAGKSYLLDLTRIVIEHEWASITSSGRPAITCVFHPWKFELEDSLAAGLVYTLARRAEELYGEDRSAEIQQIAKAIMASILAVGRRLFQPLDETLSLVEVGRRAFDSAEAAPAVPQIEQIQSQMRTLVNRLRDLDQALPDGKKPPLVVFVDDLDRCSPENLVTMFEWLKVHLTVEGAIYVLALDHVAAARAIVGRYRDYLGSEPDIAYGFRYLEKLVDADLELLDSPDVVRMALQQTGNSKDGEGRISEVVRRRCGDFPSIGSLDALTQMSCLSQPRTMLKIVGRFFVVLDLILSERGSHLRGMLPTSYPYWLFFLTCIHFRLEPFRVRQFVRGEGDLVGTLTGEKLMEEGHPSGPWSEFLSFGRGWFRTASSSARLPQPQVIALLGRIVSEIALPPAGVAVPE